MESPDDLVEPSVPGFRRGHGKGVARLGLPPGDYMLPAEAPSGLQTARDRIVYAVTRVSMGSTRNSDLRSLVWRLVRTHDGDGGVRAQIDALAPSLVVGLTHAVHRSTTAKPADS